MSRVNYKHQYERLVNIVSALESSLVVLEGKVDTIKEHLDPHSGHLHRSINQLKNSRKSVSDIYSEEISGLTIDCDSELSSQPQSCPPNKIPE